MASYFCLDCGHYWKDPATTEQAIRARLADVYDCHPEDVHPEDVWLAEGECPGCGFLGGVREVTYA